VDTASTGTRYHGSRILGNVERVENIKLHRARLAEFEGAVDEHGATDIDQYIKSISEVPVF